MKRFLGFLCLLVLATAVLLWAATVTKDPTGADASAGTWSSTAYTQVNDYPDSSCTSVVTNTALGASNACGGGVAESCVTWTYAAFSIPDGSTSISVQVLYYDKDASSGTNTSMARLKVGGNYYNGTSHNPTTTCTTRSDNWANNPKSSAAWTVAQVNGTDGTNPLQAFGFYTTDTTPNVSWASARLQVTYTPPGGRKGQTIIAHADPKGLSQ